MALPRNEVAARTPRGDGRPGKGRKVRLDTQNPGGLQRASRPWAARYFFFTGFLAGAAALTGLFGFTVGTKRAS